MVIDIHLHTAEYSSCSRMPMSQLLQRATEVGLDALCITDHESNAWAEQSADLAVAYNIPIFVGAELLTYEGDLLVFGLNSLPTRMLHASELIDLVKAAGGVCIAAHPFRDNGRGMGPFESELRVTHGIEAYNGNTADADNQRAVDIADRLSLPRMGGSDSHDTWQIGKFATRFSSPVSSLDQFIRAVQIGDTIPVEYQNGRFVDR